MKGYFYLVLLIDMNKSAACSAWNISYLDDASVLRMALSKALMSSLFPSLWLRFYQDCLR